MSRWRSKSFIKEFLSSQAGLTPKETILIILACTFIALVIVLAGFALNRIEEKIKTDAGKALQIVQQTTRESLNLWIESNKFDLTLNIFYWCYKEHSRKGAHLITGR